MSANTLAAPSSGVTIPAPKPASLVPIEAIPAPKACSFFSAARSPFTSRLSLMYSSTYAAPARMPCDNPMAYDPSLRLSTNTCLSTLIPTF